MYCVGEERTRPCSGFSDVARCVQTWKLSPWLTRSISSRKAIRPLSVATRWSPGKHGFDALIRPVFFTGFHLFVVVSYCMPGSPQTHAASATSEMSSRALYFFQG